MQEFFTRQRAEEGVKIPLIRPDGKETEHWIKIRGVDSDAFRLAELEANRERAKALDLPSQTERDRASLEIRTKLLAALVFEWSFAEPCEFNTVVTFLTEAPQIADAINAKAGMRSSFFKQGQPSSVTGTEPT